MINTFPTVIKCMHNTLFRHNTCATSKWSLQKFLLSFYSDLYYLPQINWASNLFAMKSLSRLFKCIPLRAMFLEHSFSAESNIHLIFPCNHCFRWASSKDRFKSTNAVLSVWSGLLYRQHSWSSQSQLQCSQEVLPSFSSAFTRTLHFALRIPWKVLLKQKGHRDLSTPGNGYSSRREKSFAIDPVLMKSLFQGNDRESCCWQDGKQTLNLMRRSGHHQGISCVDVDEAFVQEGAFREFMEKALSAQTSHAFQKCVCPQKRQKWYYYQSVHLDSPLILPIVPGNQRVHQLLSYFQDRMTGKLTYC